MPIPASSTHTLSTTVSTAAHAPALRDLPAVLDPGAVAPGTARDISPVFFERLRTLQEGSRAYSYVRGTLIEMNMSLVRVCARRFSARGPQEMDDIVQAGMVGLVKAIDRFDLSRENEFTTFAIPYIVGEIKRHFRDTSWSVHVPRRLQELRIQLAKARDHLTAALDTPPTVAELAAYLNLSEDEVTDGLIAANGYNTDSLDLGGDSDDDAGPSHADTTGSCDPALELFEDLHTLGPLLRQLDVREQRILRMRFGQDMSQADIGRELGVTQMQISRLLARILGKLRTGMLTDQ
ncbi:RNA polymerase, sigma 37 subunit, RpsB/SigB [Actinacidiphila alni]|uniref:RNA polymerase, sigma 37 subunit, RpsB/SigB n=1 Tax=Actinacidiphila alni TaxID=380248 RepID=A0A1I2MJR0_9ACTN|nr:SigB/SigF/SigG family RNA polymerase sigma factor [Actinacidiphila alni]SFF90959.1 RNA polymerase, sigma 37 subunit, RpsB/SigB [Actinacidiphila alni]